MGHQHLLNLPRTRAWRAVLDLLARGGDLTSIAAETSRAAQKSMIEASQDETVRQSFFLLCNIPLAASGPRNFPEALRRSGLNVGDDPDLLEICTAAMDAIDRFTTSRGYRTDYGEIAQLAAIESLNAVIGRELGDMFGTNERLRATVAGFAKPNQFAVLARDFFARLTRRHLNFYLSRELAAHVGAGRLFPSLVEHEKFEVALDIHCHEATRIIKEFSAGWFNKHVREGGIDRDLAGRFVHVATGKIREELERRDHVHA